MARRLPPPLQTDSAQEASPVSVDFSLQDREATHPPFQAYRRLRKEGNVVFLPRHSLWLAIGYDAVKDALARPEDFSTDPQQGIDAVLLGAGPSAHAPVRRLVARYFNPPRSAKIVAAAEADADELIGSSFDLAQDFAVPLSRRAAARFVGLTEAEIGSVLRADDLSQPLPSISSASRRLLSRSRLFEELLADGEGLIGEPAALSLVRLFCRAATETTERLIVRSAVFLLDRNDVRSRVEQAPNAVAAFIEEVARLFPPETNLVRRTSTPVELDGIKIPACAHVFLSLLAANRDPLRFSDPDELLLERERILHLAFSAGAHHCIGAGLARQLTATALDGLVARAFRSAKPEELETLEVVHGMATPRRVTIAT